MFSKLSEAFSVTLNIPCNSGCKKHFVRYFKYFILSLVGIVIFKITLYDFAKFSQSTGFLYFYHTDYKCHFFFSFLRGCLHVKFHPEIKLSLSMMKLSYCFHVFVGMKFHPGMNSSLSKNRDEIKFHNKHVYFFSLNILFDHPYLTSQKVRI